VSGIRGVRRIAVGLIAVIVVACSASSSPAPSRDPLPSGSPSASSQPSASPSAGPVGEGTWEPAGTTGFVGADGKSGGSAVQLADGQVLVVGDPADREEPTAASAELWDPGSNRWAETTGLERYRVSFALVALLDGRALVIGGLNGDWGSPGTQSYSSAYAFDPGNATWSKVGLMTMARTAPAAAVLPDGRVLVVGGYFHTGFDEEAAVPWDDGGIVLAAYHPDPSPPFRARPPLDDVDVPPYGYALATAEIYDPATDTWSATGPMQYARVAPEIVSLADGRILVVGSSDRYSVTGGHRDAFTTAEVYDPVTGRFSPAGSLPSIDHGAVADMGVILPQDEGDAGATGTLVAQPDGDAVLVGNVRWWKHTAEIIRSFRLEVGSKTWTEVGRPCASARDDAQERWVYTDGCEQAFAFTVGLLDGRALGAGGSPLPPPQDEWQPVPDARLLDPVSGDWTPAAPMPTAREGGLAVALDDGSVLVFGGLVDGEYGRDAIRWVPGS
jgi:hypothetical protein